jgi:spore coat protein H
MVDVRALARVLCPVAALMLSACSESADSVDVAGPAGQAGTGAVVGTGGAGATVGGAETLGGTATVPEPVDPLTVEQRCAKLDEELGEARPTGWSTESHCKEAAPNYDSLFGADIKRLDIVVTPQAYDGMQQDLEALMSGEGGGGEGPGPQPTACEGKQVGDACVDDFGGGAGVCTDWGFDELLCYVPPPASETEPCVTRQDSESCSIGSDPGHCFSDGVTLVCLRDDTTQGGEHGDTCIGSNIDDPCELGSASQGVCTQSGRLLSCQGPLDHVAEPSTPLEAAASFWPRDPAYFEATLRFEGHEWTHVGYRYKGNNGLASADPNKRPFRLKLDELEETFPEITDQRLYGFKELSFSPGGSTDASYLRQVLSAEMFARAGVPTPRSSLVSVYLDKGGGPELMGVYAMTEVPADPFTERVFDDKNGCLYKPDGLGAHLMKHHPESFHPKSDSCPVDQIDVQRLIGSLNAEIVDRATWREQLGQAIDLPALIRFFAANQANGNWDTYGGLAHNYFLYGKSSGGPLHFVPWDFDLSLEATYDSDFSLDGFTGEWPLLQAVARDSELYSAYHVALEEIAAREYESGLLEQRVAELSVQLRPLVAAEGADVALFDEEIARIQDNLAAARDSLRVYLDSRGFSYVR